jgi:tRNA-2-methylthio-N6-dimethylallyladenosine synthase
MQGRSENNRVVNFDGGPNASRLIGQMLDLHITHSYAYSLRGEVPVRQ